MANLQSCFELLTRETEILQSLLSLAREKQRALLEGAAANLANIVGREEVVVKETEKVEQLRLDRFSELAGSRGLPPEATLSKIAEVCSREEGLALMEKGDVLKGLVRELQELNGQNARMINQSLDLIRFSLRSIAGRQEPVGYNPGGEHRQSLNLLLDKRV